MKNESKYVKRNYPGVFFKEMKSQSRQEILSNISLTVDTEILNELTSLSSFDDFFNFFLNHKDKFGESFDFAAEIDGKIIKESAFYVLEKVFKFEYENINFFSFTTDEEVEIRENLSELVYHMDNSIMDSDFFEKIAKKYPEYLYTGSAYRVLKNKNYIESSMVGKSFAISLSGILHFLELDFYEANKGFTLIEHNVVGFNLVRFLTENKNLLDSGSLFSYEKYKNEEEVVVLEDIGQSQLLTFDTREEIMAYLKRS